MEKISWKDFEKVLIVSGTILRVEDFPEARKPAYKIWADFGPYGELKTSAQFTKLYSHDDLVGRQIIGVINFPEKQIGPFQSQFLLSGFETPDGVVLSSIERSTKWNTPELKLSPKQELDSHVNQILLVIQQRVKR